MCFSVSMNMNIQDSLRQNNANRMRNLLFRYQLSDTLLKACDSVFLYSLINPLKKT
jgi:hypothetical protein